jgi:hypothetical protein
MNLKTISILSILIVGIAVSGCINSSEDTSSDETISSTQTSISDSESVSLDVSTDEVMDGEISIIEADMLELEALLNDIESIQEENFSELDGLDI